MAQKGTGNVANKTNVKLELKQPNASKKAEALQQSTTNSTSKVQAQAEIKKDQKKDAKVPESAEK